MLWRPLQGDLPTSPAIAVVQLGHQCRQQKFVLVLPPILIVPSWSSSASAIILSKKMLKRVGESRHPWHTPIVVGNHFPMVLSW